MQRTLYAHCIDVGTEHQSVQVICLTVVTVPLVAETFWLFTSHSYGIDCFTESPYRWVEVQARDLINPACLTSCLQLSSLFFFFLILTQ